MMILNQLIDFGHHAGLLGAGRAAAPGRWYTMPADSEDKEDQADGSGVVNPKRA
jgi:hypothetical protein